MNFTEIAKVRQSCRKYNAERAVEDEKLTAILESARLSPSACNGQPYHITVCRGEKASEVAEEEMKNHPIVEESETDEPEEKEIAADEAEENSEE